MNTEAATMEPPPSAPPSQPGVTPQDKGQPASPGLAAAAKAHEEFLRTGQKPPSAPAKKDAPVQKEPTPPAKKEEPAKKPGAGALADIKPKPAAPPAKKEEPKKEEPGKKEQPGVSGEEQAKELSRWKELKAAEDELKELKPKWDATQKEKETWQAEKAKWEEERKELEELRRVRDFTDVTKTKRYQEEVDTPFNAIHDQAEEVAVYGKMDVNAIMRILNEPNSLVRSKKLAAYIEENSKETIPPDQITKLSLAGDQLKGIFAKMSKFHEEATQQKEQYENQQKAEKLRVETETQQIREKAQNEALSILKTNASDVISEEDLTTAFERSKNRRSEPMDDAFRDVSEFLVPTLIEKNREKDQRIAQLEEELKAATDARPGITPSKDKADGKQAPYASLNEAAKAHKAAGGHL